VGHPLTYRASPLKYSALTLYLVGLQGSTGSDRLGCAILPRLGALKSESKVCVVTA
jgi:hypothetical protein